MISDRIEALITHFCNGNKSLFAQQIGVRPSVIGNITGERKGNPSFEVVQKILDAFASINPDWFIFDKGEMLRADESKSLASVDSATIPKLSDTITLRFMDKLDEKDKIIKEKDDEIAQLQIELRSIREELITIKAKFSKYESSPPFGSKEKEITMDLDVAGNACSDIAIQKPSSHIKKSDSATAQ